MSSSSQFDRSRTILKVFAAIVLFFNVSLLSSSNAQAGYFEVSGGAYFTKSTYSDSDFNWVRRYGANIGYHLTEMCEIEFTYQDVVDRTVINGFEDTTFHDSIYGITWNQSLTPKGVGIQPYFKVGIGQLNRTATGAYSGGVAPPAELDQVTGIGALGLRLYLTRSFGLRGEATTYLTSGGLSTWKNNISTTVGVSIYF